MSDEPSYAPPVAVGDVMVGGIVSRSSRHHDYAAFIGLLDGKNFGKLLVRVAE
jgi:NADPH-dependent curcumin reductase CurA